MFLTILSAINCSIIEYSNGFLHYRAGFFITLSFVTTKKVRGLLKNAFFKRFNVAVEPQTSVSRDQRTGSGNTDIKTAAS